MLITVVAAITTVQTLIGGLKAAFAAGSDEVTEEMLDGAVAELDAAIDAAQAAIDRQHDDA